MHSPRIIHISWGKIDAEGLPRAKDLKLFPGGGREWDWAETGTKHRPGIQPSDVQELLDHGCTTVVLSRGMHEALQVSPETLVFLESNGIEVYTLETRQAAQLYNELAASNTVGALLHSTC
jgi:hypothetical protein